MSANNLSSHELMLALHSAVKEENNLPEIKRLLDLGADVNARDDKNRNFTALHVAADYSYHDIHFSIVKILLKNGTDVNAKDTNDNSILHYLVRYNDLKSEELLLNFGPDAYIKSIRDETPLYQGLFNTEFKNKKLPIDVNESKSLHPLFKKWYLDRMKMIKLLLINGANIDAISDKYDLTPFYIMVLLSRKSKYTDEKLLKFFLKYAKIRPVKFPCRNILWIVKEADDIWKPVIKHVAKLLKLNLTVEDPGILKCIPQDKKFKDYFSKCLEELEVVKSTKLQGCWVTYFNLLVDNKRKLKNYAGNRDLTQNFYESDCLKKFPIYGPEIFEKVEKGIRRRKLFDDSTVELSLCLPIFNSTHLVIRDILDCLSFKDCDKFLPGQDGPISNQEITYSRKRKIS